MAQCNYWNVNYIMFQWFTIGLFSKYNKNVNIQKYTSNKFISVHQSNTIFNIESFNKNSLPWLVV